MRFPRNRVIPATLARAGRRASKTMRRAARVALGVGALLLYHSFFRAA
jgi:hypothetical protein